MANVKYAHVNPEFVKQMDQEISANQHKGEWQDWQPRFELVEKELVYHVHKLSSAVASSTIHSSPGEIEKAKALVRELSADIANFAMKVWEVQGH